MRTSALTYAESEVFDNIFMSSGGNDQAHDLSSLTQSASVTDHALPRLRDVSVVSIPSCSRRPDSSSSCAKGMYSAPELGTEFSAALEREWLPFSISEGSLAGGMPSVKKKMKRRRSKSRSEKVAACENQRVYVGKSQYGAGRGVFASRDFSRGELVCFFHGRRISTSRVALFPSSLQDQMGRYMMSGPFDYVCVPVCDNGLVPKVLPGAFSGCLINEASVVDGVHRKPNVLTVLPPPPMYGAYNGGCPAFGDTETYDWPVVATRPIKKNEELLMCYGSDYGHREGYEVSGYCKAC